MEILAPTILETSKASAEKVYDYYFYDFKFYHGTSSNVIDDIMQNGIIPKKKPYVQKELFGADQVLYDNPIKQLKRARNKHWISISLGVAIEHAFQGPEYLGDSAIGPAIIAEDGRANHLSDNQKKALSDIKRKYLPFINSHNPEILIINPQSARIKEYMSKTVSGFAKILFDKDLFCLTTRARAKKSGYTEGHEADSLADNIMEFFDDFWIDIPILPDEFKRMTREAVWEVDNELKLYWKAKQIFLSGIIQQPPAMIETLSRLLDSHYPFSDEDLRGCMKSYEIESESREIIWSRVREYLANTTISA